MGFGTGVIKLCWRFKTGGLPSEPAVIFGLGFMVFFAKYKGSQGDAFIGGGGESYELDILLMGGVKYQGKVPIIVVDM